MIVETSLRSFSVAVGSLAAAVSLLGLLWRHREEPTARPLLWLSAVLSGTLVLHFLHVHFAPTHRFLTRTGGSAVADTFWTPFVFVCYSVVLGLWTVFVFEFTGRGRRLVRFVSGIVGLTVLGEVGVFLLFDLVPVISLVVADATIVGSLIVLVVLTAVGVLLVLDESTGQGPLQPRNALVLSGVGVVLATGTWVFLSFGSPMMFTTPTLVGSCLLVLAVRRYSLFETLPAARVVGRDRVIDEMTEAVVVLGRDGQVQDVNPAGAELFDLDATAGKRWQELVPVDRSPADMAATDKPTRMRMGNRVATVTATSVHDDRDRLLGYLLVCQDVTDRRERERRFAVLNRFLVETVREQMEGVSRHAGRLAARPDSDRAETAEIERLGTAIHTTTSNLGALVTYARELEQGVVTDDRQASEVGSVVTCVVESLATDGNRPSAVIPDSPSWARIEPSLLESTLELLATEAVDQPASALELTVSAGSDWVEVNIAPGGQRDGLSVSAETETEGTGVTDHPSLGRLAVQLVRLVVDAVGGTLAVDDRIVLQVPAVTPAEAQDETRTPQAGGDSS